MSFARYLLDVLLPTPCAACGALAGDGALVRLCAACEAQLPGQPWPLAHEISGIASGWYLAPYEGLGGDLVRKGKYGLREELLVELADLAARAAAPALPAVDALVPVPSPLGRRMQRGFTLPGILCAALAERLEVPVLSLLKRRGGARQAQVGRAERWENLRGVVRPASEPPPGSTLLLVDDVVTTGATAGACADVLLQGGAGLVHLFAFASALG